VKPNWIDGRPVPTAFVAVTRQLYDLPVVSPVTVIGDLAEVTEPVAPPLLEVHVAVYEVIALPPVVPAVNVITAEPGVWVTVEIDGAPGTAATTNRAEATDAGLLPKPLVASTVHEYVLPLLSDATVIGEDAPVADWVAPPLLEVHDTA
jgi:hypothetical protein